MKVRTRLNLWYSAILCGVALAVVAAACYHEFFIENRPAHHHHERENDSGDLLDVLAWTVIPAVVLGLAGGWWLTRQALTPVARLTDAAEKIHEGNLRQQLPRTGNGDELDRLTEVFNAMTARLDNSFQRIREFTLHASHELKTPLTVLHGEIETELGTENLSPVQREKFSGQLDELQRLTKIVDGLTLLTKADAGQIELRFAPLALDEIVRDVFADAQILAKPADISVRLANSEKLSVNGDRHRLRQLLLNLTDNAVKYNQPGGMVEFSLRRDGAEAELTVSNTGKHIASEALRRVFERFFRGDPAHNSAVDGCGLGLSIAQWIVHAHHGDIRIASADNRTTVTVRLPLAAEEKKS
jgi:signal transduction histidine kinase